MATNYMYGTSLDNVSNAAKEEVEVASTQGSWSGSALVPNTVSSYSPCLHYHLSIFKNKGAVLVLLMSFCGFCIFQFLSENYYDEKILLVVGKKKVSPEVVVTMCLLLFPIFGWLADVRYGRYKVTKWSLRITLIALILFCLASALSQKMPTRLLRALRVILYVLVTLGLGGFQANIIQFGIDQLTDASSTEIMSFIRWYSWVWFLSDCVIGLSQSCLCSDFKAATVQYSTLGFLLLPTVITLAICSEIVCNHWLVKEPASDNPFVLIFKVLRYAAKNKYPRLRNAFTYWDDKPYHRIDLAKTKYGGPYTTEQVEDVKTFFRIMSIIILGAFFTGLYIAVFPIYDKIFYHLRDVDYKKGCEFSHAYIKNCFQRTAVRDLGSYIMVIGLPLFEFVVYPFFKRYFRMSILRKAMIGVVLFFLSVASCAAIEFAAQHESRANQQFGVCPLDLRLQKIKPNSLSLDYKWMTLPYSLNYFAQYVFLTSAAEFLCAQSPYSMKGLLFGFAYGSVGFFAIVGYLLMVPVKWITERKIFHNYGCMFWYLIFSLGIFTVILVLLFVAIKCYKRRTRNNIDNEHNEE